MHVKKKRKRKAVLKCDVKLTFFLVEKSLRCWNILYICIKSCKVSERISWWAEKPATWPKQWRKSFVTLGKNSEKHHFHYGKPEGKRGRSHRSTQSSGVHLSAGVRNKKRWSIKVAFWFSFSSVVVWLCAAYANIVVLLCSLSSCNIFITVG